MVSVSEIGFSNTRYCITSAYASSLKSNFKSNFSVTFGNTLRIIFFPSVKCSTLDEESGNKKYKADFTVREIFFQYFESHGHSSSGYFRKRLGKRGDAIAIRYHPTWAKVTKTKTLL